MPVITYSPMEGDNVLTPRGPGRVSCVESSLICRVMLPDSLRPVPFATKEIELLPGNVTPFLKPFYVDDCTPCDVEPCETSFTPPTRMPAFMRDDGDEA